MHRVSNTIGLPVVIANTGRQLGKVKDVWFHPDWSVYGAVVEFPHWWSPKAKVILWDDIGRIGRDGLMIHSKRVVRRTGDADQIYGFVWGKTKLKDLSVMTAGGERLGTVTDVYFNPKVGNKVTGIEISDGFISDLIEGRKWFPIPETVILGDEMIVVPECCASNLEKTVTLHDG